MKTIHIKRMILTNFKGIKDFVVEFADNVTDIFGDNATGKSTLFDAFTWTLFGKDSNDRKDFEVKTLDSQNKVIPKIDHEVTIELEIDGELITIKRALRENWVKQRGSSIAEFAGNVTSYFWNEVPMQQKEFQAKVSGILDENVFKLITNPFAFDNLKWQDRRMVLMQMAGGESDSQIIDRMANLQNKDEISQLIAVLNSGKTIEDYKKQLAVNIRNMKDELKQFPTRIAEVQHNTPEALDFDAIRKDLANHEAELQSIENQLTNKSAAFNSVYQARQQEQSVINNILTEIGGIETTARIEANDRLKDDTSIGDGISKQISEKESELRTFENSQASLETKAKNLNYSIDSLDRRIKDKRNEWEAENTKELSFDEGCKTCPTCKRDYDASQLETEREQLLADFRANKTSKLAMINSQGLGLKTEKENAQKELEEITGQQKTVKESKEKVSSELVVLRQKLSEATSDTTVKPSFDEVYDAILTAHPLYNVKKQEVVTLKSAMTAEPKLDNDDLKSKKFDITNRIDARKRDLAVQDQIAKSSERIEQLQTEESKLANEIANIEKVQFAMDSFIKFKIDTLEQKINQMFKFVKFKLFKQNINGGEEECCEALINGVPFSNANNAAKINAGVDIINTLCNYYQVNAPIFIDNRESVVSLIDCQSQIVNLIVSASDKKLRIENKLQLHDHAA